MWFRAGVNPAAPAAESLSRIDKITGPVCNRALQKRLNSAKETWQLQLPQTESRQQHMPAAPSKKIPQEAAGNDFPVFRWLMIAFITRNSNLVPLLEGLRSSNPCRFGVLGIWVFARIHYL